MESSSLILAYGLIVIAIFISYLEGLGLERDLTLNSLQATVQLIAMGFILQIILEIQNMKYIVLILLFMCAVAASITGRAGRKIPNAFAISFLGIGLGSLVTFLSLYWAGVIPSEARFAIPIGGMIIGNAMKAGALSLNHLSETFDHHRARIETLLALGASPRQAANDPLNQSVRAAMIPTIANLKTVGVVHLPGVMTGFIIAGGSPFEAVKFQLAVMYMITGATAVTCLIVSLLGARRCFNRNFQLIGRFRASSPC